MLDYFSYFLNAATVLNPECAGNKGESVPDGEYTTLIFKCLLYHPPEAVWKAITEPEQLKAWLMCSSARIDGRKGGRVEMVAGPAQSWMERFQEVAPLYGFPGK